MIPPFYGTPNRVPENDGAMMPPISTPNPGVPEKRPVSTRSTTRTVGKIAVALTLLALLTVVTLVIHLYC